MENCTEEIMDNHIEERNRYIETDLITHFCNRIGIKQIRDDIFELFVNGILVAVLDKEDLFSIHSTFESIYLSDNQKED